MTTINNFQISSVIVRILFWIPAIFFFFGTISAPVNAQHPSLDDEDSAAILTAQMLVKAYGDTVWPDFSTPPHLLLRTGDGEFLVDHPTPPQEFEPVPSLEIAGSPVYFTDEPLTPGPVATSWPVEDLWGVALPVRSELQIILDDVLGPDVVILDETMYVRVIVHEMFHAYQMSVLDGPQNLPVELLGPSNMAWLEQLSEADMIALDEAHAAEGSLLRAALDAKTDSEMYQYAAEFLRLRQTRREALSPDYASELIAYERSIEWIEGQARYVEIALIQHAPELDQDQFPAGFAFQNAEVIWRDFLDQLQDPGAIPGSIRERYAALGAGEAFLLDRMMPGWQSQVLNDGMAIEDVLAEAVALNADD